MALVERLQEADAILQRAREEYDPSHIFVLFSGGHDSLTTTHVAMRHPDVQSVIHINTGIGIEQTRHFVRETCAAHDWPLIEEHPPNLSYDEMVLKHGFPGPGGHLYPYVWLKDRALRKIIRERRVKGRNVMLITGVRAEEGKRRMGWIKDINKEKSSRVVWVAPLINWTSFDTTTYIAENKLKRNDVVNKIHMSGECLCGAFAKPNELRDLEMWFPDVVERIHALERKAEQAGVHCVWGTRPPKFYSEKQKGQLELDMPMCVSCVRQEPVADEVA